MGYELHFELKGLPKVTTNANKTWKARWAEAKKWKTLIEQTVIYHQIGPPKPLKLAKVVLTRFAFGRRPDADNLRSSFKHVLDGLVHARVLVDDSHAVIGEPVVHWHYAPPREGRIRIEVIEVVGPLPEQ